MADYAGQNTNGGANMTVHMPNQRMVAVDVNEFIRTRDALLSAHLNLSTAFERAVKAYLDHTQVVLNGDATLNVGHMLSTFSSLGSYGNPAQVAALALQQQQGSGADVKDEEPDKKRKKRAYKPRDLNAPKRPMTAYFRYLAGARPTISEEIQQNPEKFKDNSGVPGGISMVASERWKALTPAEQEPYKKAYRDELEDWKVRAAAYAKAKGLSVEGIAGADEDATGFTEGGDGVDQPTHVTAAVKKVVPQDDDDETDDDDSSSDDSDDSDDEPAPPPPPKAAATPKKSALKKNKTAAATAPQTFSSVPTPSFSSINAPAPVPVPTSSPSRKRKSDAEEGEPTKKRARKPKETPASEPVVPAAPTSSNEEIQVADASAKKKEKKKRKAKGDA